jgi:hypothetical protein
MAYITIANAMRIVRDCEPGRLSTIAEELYHKKIEIFSRQDYARLLGVKSLFRNAERFVKQYYVCCEANCSSNMVYDHVQLPAYHSSARCENLLSDFENFVIPPEVELRGEHEVQRYRTYFQALRMRLGDREDLLKMRLSAEFSLALGTLGKVIYGNSGSLSINNVSVSGLESQIDSHLLYAESFCRSSDMNSMLVRRYGKLAGWLKRQPTIRSIPDGMTEAQVRRFCVEYDANYRQPLKRMLMTYFKIKYNPDLDFDGDLLEGLGFRHCRKCFLARWDSGYARRCAAAPSYAGEPVSGA